MRRIVTARTTCPYRLGGYFEECLARFDKSDKLRITLSDNVLNKLMPPVEAKMVRSTGMLEGVKVVFSEALDEIRIDDGEKEALVEYGLF